MVSRSLILAIAAASALSACALDPQAGYRPMQQTAASAAGISDSSDLMSFDEANAQCWGIAYSLLGGNAMDSARTTAYNKCMNDRGWENPSLPARARPLTVPGSR